MTWMFWCAAALISYAYLGYPIWLFLRSRWRRQPVHPYPYYRDPISVVMVVRNEAEVLPRKLRNLLEIDPALRPEIIVASDGSTDGTNAILSEFAETPGVHVILNPQPRGKAASLNDAIRTARGEIVVFTDARQRIEPQAVRLLLENFSDPSVGCASGELMLGNPDLGEAGQGLSLYWRTEKKIREMESLSGSVIGATGALYAVRRGLLVPLPPDTILDDVYIPMHVIRKGSRVVFDARARAWDVPDLVIRREFARKVRTLSGNYQLLQLVPWLLSNRNPTRFEFVSHKLLRLVVPFALAAMLLSSLMLHHPFYRAALVLQFAFYGLGIWGLIRPKWGPLSRVADAALTFVLLNTAALVAFAHFVSGRKVAWSR